MCIRDRLTRLRTEDGQAAAPIELPDELWVKILMAVQMDDPCAQLTKWCDTEKKWGIWCRDGTLYEAANRQLGWYGRFESLKAVQAHVKGMAGFPIWTPPPTAKLYFQEVCKALHRARGVGSNPPWLLERRYLERPYWPVIAERVLRAHPGALLMLPENVPGYADLALAAVRRDFTLFDRLPKTLSNYGEVFKVSFALLGLQFFTPWFTVVDDAAPEDAAPAPPPAPPAAAPAPAAEPVAPPPAPPASEPAPAEPAAEPAAPPKAAGLFKKKAKKPKATKL